MPRRRNESRVDPIGAVVRVSDGIGIGLGDSSTTLDAEGSE